MDSLNSSPFHKGEQEIQKKLGVRESMEKFGRKVIRGYLPEQHREFYHQLPFIFVGHTDQDGWPWASVVVGGEGFITSRDNTQLEVNILPLDGDPLHQTIEAKGSRIGVLGMEPQSRRRNRLTGAINTVDNSGFTLDIQQTFGNCPQYIQTRDMEFIDSNRSGHSRTTFDTLDERARQLISRSDTFFVASSAAKPKAESSAKPSSENVPTDESYGADISHRGGQQGFVKVDDDGVLTIPDYHGNNHYNTLGNFHLNPKAGLLFIDFESRDILMITGRVEILWDDPKQHLYEGAQRFWTFTLDHGIWLNQAFPMHTRFGEYSPNSILTGNWDQAEANALAHAQRTQFQEYRIEKIESESNLVKSFYFQPLKGSLPTFKPGQFLTIRITINGRPLTRNYTVSNAPGEPHYRISVKRKTHDISDSNNIEQSLSNTIHNTLNVGGVVDIKAPTGEFYFDAECTRPAVLLAAGIGITPMIAMLRHAIFDSVRRRHIRNITLIVSVRFADERVFFSELDQLEAQSGGYIRIFWIISQPEPNLILGQDYHHRGRLNVDVLRSALHLDDYDYYLCGPASYMQSTYEILRSLGAQDSRINAEAFGPASIERDVDECSAATDQTRNPTNNPATEAVVTFIDTNKQTLMEQRWDTSQGTLLELAEAHGLSPSFSCRSGNCGACKSTLSSGQISTVGDPLFITTESELLLCSSVPAESDEPMPNIVITIEN